MMTKRHPLIVGGLMALMLTVAAWYFVWSSDQSPEASSDDMAIIRIALPADIQGTNPGVERDARTDDILHHIVEGLVAYRENMTVGPMLAAVVDQSPDGKTYRFELRKGLKFHNGSPVTSAEVKWSWDRMLDPKTNWLCRNFFDGENGGDRIEKIETPDPMTIIFRLSEPSAMFLDNMASLQCITAILHPSSVDEQQKWIAPVGTGPYKLKEWRRGQYVELVRFDGYQSRTEPRDGLTGAKIAHAKRLRWMIIPDNASAKAALYARQLDLINLLSPADRAEMTKVSYVHISSSPSLGSSTLLMQTRDPVLRDARIRKAIAHAVGIGPVTQAALLGQGSTNPSLVPTSSPYHSKAHDAGYAYDPEKARQLLRAAGYNGQLIKLQTNKRYQSMYDNTVIAQSMMRKVGFNVELEVVEWTTQFSNYMEGKFQMMSMDFSARTDPAASYDTILGRKSDYPSNQWENPRAMELNRAAAKISNQNKRQAMFDEMHGLMIADAPILVLYNDHVLDASSDRLVGYKAWPAAKARLWGVRVTK